MVPPKVLKKLKKLPTTIIVFVLPFMQEKKIFQSGCTKLRAQKKLSIYNEDYINLVKDVMQQIVTLLKLLSQLQAVALQLY